MSEPNLGTTWESAIKSAYVHGFDAWDNSYVEIKDIVQKESEENGEDIAIDMLTNQYDYVTGEGSTHREIWWAIDEFFAEHMSEEMNERYQREAAVAEDIYCAYESGCYDGILGKEKDLSKLSMFYE